MAEPTEEMRAVSAANVALSEAIASRFLRTAHVTLFKNARRLCARQYKRSPNWVIAMELFGVGSSYAHEFCRFMDIDPDSRDACIKSESHNG